MPFLIYGLILALGLVLRLHYIADQRLLNPLFYHPLMDAKIHLDWARYFFEGYPLSQPPFFRCPLYPLFLRLLISVFGFRPLLLILIQSCLGLANIFLLCILARQITGNRTLAYLTGLIAVLYWPLLYFESEFMMETLFIFFTLIAHCLLFRGLERRKRATTALAGFCLGLAAITRPNILIVIPVYLLLLYLRREFRPAIKFLVPGLLIPILCLTAINVIYGKDLVLISTQAGINFYIGNNRMSDGASAVYPEGRQDWWGGYVDSFRIPRETLKQPRKPSQVSRFWSNRAWRDIRQNPGRWLGLLLKKTVMLTNNFEISDNYPIYYFKNLSAIMRLPLPSFGFIVMFIIPGIIYLRRYPYSRFIHAYVLLYSFGIIAFFVSSRYRLPIAPFLIIIAASGIYYVFELYHTRTRVALTMMLLAVAAAGILTFFNWLRIAPHPYEHFLVMADIHREQGRYESAIINYQQALAVSQRNNPAWVNLGVTLMELQQYDAAEKTFSEALAHCPFEPLLFSNLGIIAFIRADYQPSETYFRQALALDPNLDMPNLYLSKIYCLHNDLVQAQVYLDRYSQLTTQEYDQY